MNNDIRLTYTVQLGLGAAAESHTPLFVALLTFSSTPVKRRVGVQGLPSSPVGA
jgi:hypothetical protein